MKDNRIRLQKYMSENGFASRRKSEELIMAGKVKVNGDIATRIRCILCSINQGDTLQQ